MWIALLGLVLFVAFVWMKQSMIASDDSTKAAVMEHYERMAGTDETEDDAFIESLFEIREQNTTKIVFITMILFGFVLVVMLTNHSYMSRR